MRFALGFVLLFALLIPESRAAQSMDDKRAFGAMLQMTAIRLGQVASRRPFRYKNFNNSLGMTAQAAYEIMEEGSLKKAWELLKRARKEYEGNHFTYLFQAVIADSRGDTEGANVFLEQFLTGSSSYTEFERSFMEWGEYHRLRRMVYDLLLSRGISFEGKEKEIQARVPLQNLMQYLMRPDPRDQFLNILFIGVIFGGGIFFLLGAFGGLDFSQVVIKTLFSIYFVFWFGYIFWLLDLVVGLPFGISRFQGVPLFLGVTSSLFVLGGVVEVFKRAFQPLEKGYRRCPRCRAVIVELSVQCPECKREIS